MAARPDSGQAGADLQPVLERGEPLKKRFRTASARRLTKTPSITPTRSSLLRQSLILPTERIVGYLNERDIPINVIFFQVFQHGEHQLLSRTWLIDPGETQANAAVGKSQVGEKEPWNGEYYVSFGDATSRSWEDARKYGYISAGGGTWYSQTLKMLSPGDRVWVNIPREGLCGRRHRRAGRSTRE